MSAEDRKKWLDGLKKGDRVAYSYGRGDAYMVAKVKKITPTRKHFEVGEDNWTRTLNEYGDSKPADRYSAPDSIEPLTEQILEIIKRGKIVKKLVETDWVKLDTATLVQIYNLINPKP